MWDSQSQTVDKVLKSISVSDERRWVSIPATLCSIFENLSAPLRLGEGRFGAGSNKKVEFIGSLSVVDSASQTVLTNSILGANDIRMCWGKNDSKYLMAFGLITSPLPPAPP